MRFIMSASPWILYGPNFSIARIPPSLTLPATIPENALRKDAASCSAGWSGYNLRFAMFSWVGSNGICKSGAIRIDQLKL